MDRPAEPCASYSPLHGGIRGRVGQRGLHSEGAAIKHAATVVGSLMEEYERRGHDAAKDGAPCGWVFETAPMRNDGEDGAVKRLKEAYAAALGERTGDVG